MSKNTEPCVWVSNAMGDTELVVGFRSEWRDGQLRRLVELEQKVVRGRATASDPYPLKYHYSGKKARPKKLPEFMSEYLVSDRLREALQTGDLGATSFHPIELYERDKVQRIDASYSIIAFGETKDTLLPEQSARIRKIPGNQQIQWRLQFVPEDFDLTLTEAALRGPELWIEQTMASAFFLSDRLVQTLKARNLAQHLTLHRCKIAATH